MTSKEHVKWIILITFALLNGGLIFAIGTQNTGYQTTVSTQLIDHHGACRVVSHTGSNSYFVPTKSSNEWLQFRNNNPADVDVCTCSFVPVVASGDPVCGGGPTSLFPGGHECIFGSGTLIGTGAGPGPSLDPNPYAGNYEILAMGIYEIGTYSGGTPGSPTSSYNVQIVIIDNSGAAVPNTSSVFTNLELEDGTVLPRASATTRSDYSNQRVWTWSSLDYSLPPTEFFNNDNYARDSMMVVNFGNSTAPSCN